MQRYLIYSGSVLASTILFILILAFAGVLGTVGAGVAMAVLKVLGWIVLYVLMVRVPIALIKANEIRNANKLRKSMQHEADALIAKASAVAAKDTIKLKVPKIDNPITPMPVDPDLE